jgi:amino acid adenylation domain-containing protein
VNAVAVDALSCVHEVFERWVDSTPEAPAVLHGDRTMSYAELDDRANRIALGLRAVGVRCGDRVGLHGGRSADYIAAMIGIFKAGAAYLPLELGLPESRLRTVAEDAAPCLVVSVGGHPPFWDGAPWVGADELAASAPDGGRPDCQVHPDDVLYIPYTSGSSGQPKGVEVPHRSFPGLYTTPPFDSLGPGDVIVHHTSLSWDAHAAEIFAALLHGGTVAVHDAAAYDPFEVMAFAKSVAATAMMLPTQVFNTLVSTDPEVLAGLEWIVIAGETASTTHTAKALDALPGLRVYNGYGPVECTAVATMHPIEPADTRKTRIPIGREAGDRVVYVLDDEGWPVEVGAPGFAVIAGPSVAHGYLGAPRLTAERFVPDPYSGVPGSRLYATGDLVERGASGVFDFVGRLDHQVKIRGFRIELGEVEAVLRGHPKLRDACAVLRRDGDEAHLTGYVISDGSGLDEKAVRAYVGERLPAAMVPTSVVFMTAFPTTSNGKLDRAALPEPAVQTGSLNTEADTHADVETGPAGEISGPYADVEDFLAGLWRDILGAPQVGPLDSFFDLGGHSLAASKVTLRAKRKYGIDLQVKDLFDAPVLKNYAAVVAGRRP